MNYLFVIGVHDYKVYSEEDCDFVQDKNYILLKGTLISKKEIDKIAIFKGELVMITFDIKNIKSYQEQLYNATEYRRLIL